MVNSVSQTSYTSYLNGSLYTHTGNNRGAGQTQHDLAKQNISALMQVFGLQTSYEDGTYWGHPYSNVVGIKPGLTDPGRILVLGAHYDSVNNPGADDDASGVAGMLEAARVLSPYQFASTLVFIAFDSEELGLIGSKGYVYSHTSDKMAGMLQLDMIAYNNSAAQYHDQVAVFDARRNRFGAFKANLVNMVNTYGDGLTALDAGFIGQSDHQSFDDINVPDGLFIEAGYDVNPYYHEAGDSVDTPSYIDYRFGTQITRAAVGWMANSAGDIPEPSCVVLFGAGLALVAFRRRRTAL